MSENLADIHFSVVMNIRQIFGGYGSSVLKCYCNVHWQSDSDTIWRCNAQRWLEVQKTLHWHEFGSLFLGGEFSSLTIMVNWLLSRRVAYRVFVHPLTVLQPNWISNANLRQFIWYCYYRVTDAEMPFYGEPPTGVWRRYSEFELLRSYLETTYPAIIVPPLPEKKVNVVLCLCCIISVIWGLQTANSRSWRGLVLSVNFDVASRLLMLWYSLLLLNAQIWWISSTSGMCRFQCSHRESYQKSDVYQSVSESLMASMT